MNTKTILTFVTLVAALAVVITPSLMAAAGQHQMQCVKKWKYSKRAKRR